MRFRIEDCVAWNYEPRALRVRDRLRTLGAEVEIAPGSHGAFEFTRDGAQVFSKLETHRFPTDEEVDLLTSWNAEAVRRPISGNGYKVRLLQALLDIIYTLVELDILNEESRMPAFLAKNTNGRIPTVEFDDGHGLSESNAILFYFAQGTAFWPDDRYDQADALRWMRFEQYSREPCVAVARFMFHLPDPPTVTGSSTSRSTPASTSPMKATSTCHLIRTFAPGLTASGYSRGIKRWARTPVNCADCDGTMGPWIFFVLISRPRLPRPARVLMMGFVLRVCADRPFVGAFRHATAVMAPYGVARIWLAPKEICGPGAVQIAPSGVKWACAWRRSALQDGREADTDIASSGC